MATKAALEFVGHATLEGLTRQKVATDIFAPGEALDHINLARWADVMVVCPATANTLNRMAAGLADDLAGALLLAHEWHKPLLVAPAMNPAMWSHPATQASVARLGEWGARFINPGEGRTACGEVGEGRLAEPDEIVAAIEAALSKPKQRLRVLVTSGGTSEPIDGVRMLTNFSTGRTGAMIATHFSRAGHEVVLLRANASAAAEARVEDETFLTVSDLDAALERRLRAESIDAVIHAAAVSYFAVDRIEVAGRPWKPSEGKLPSAQPPTLHLRTTPKLLDTLRTRSRKSDTRVVAFKLTRGADAAATRSAVETILETGSADFVVHNDLTQLAQNGAFPADIWQRDGAIAVHCPDRASIAPALERLLLEGNTPAAGAKASRDPKA